MQFARALVQKNDLAICPFQADDRFSDADFVCGLGLEGSAVPLYACSGVL